PLFTDARESSDLFSINNLDLNQTLTTVGKQLIEKAMTQAHGVKTVAARLLGVKTSALYYKLEKYGLL
ncbi:MAG: helix-turn-helix domain-containing protein, partial [bacterium]